MTQKNNLFTFETLLRSRLFWISIPFIFVLVWAFLMFIMGNTTVNLDDPQFFNDFAFSMLLALIIGFYSFPLFVREGLGMTHANIPLINESPLIPLLWIPALVLFLIYLKKIKKNYLFIIALILLVIILIGLKGCLSADYSM